MLKAHPAVLRNLLAIHASLGREITEGSGSSHARRQLLDTEYTLCMSTGTYTVEDALAAAHRQLEEAEGAEGAGAGAAAGARTAPGPRRPDARGDGYRPVNPVTPVGRYRPVTPVDRYRPDTRADRYRPDTHGDRSSIA
ncbi:DUF5133 domain-containing protein [Streptomyces sp. NPDC088789]|uniref:DUF5133 domain-containing protein n=1 Tax=Streptomyces sp. NPDC088789 TaxID=3365899 RepID=UPI00380D2748